jgi:hypothetical protein
MAGRWVAAPPSAGTGLSPDAAREAAAPLIGGWGEPGQPPFLEFRDDGTYSWGPGIGGTYTMLDAPRVRMVLMQEGKAAGQLDHLFTVTDGRLTLTAPDGAVTTYQRVP